MSDEQMMNVEEVVQPVSQEQIRPPEESAQERNWREARIAMSELKEELRRERERRAELERAAHKPQEEEDDEEEDVWLTKKEAKKLAQRYAQQAATEAFQRQAQAELPSKLKSRYPDFDDVVTEENVNYLKATKPEFVSLLQTAGSDPYSAAVTAYEFIKAVKPGASMEKYHQQKMEQNAQKPMSSAAASGTGAISGSGDFERGLTPDLRRQLYQEMQEAMKAR